MKFMVAKKDGIKCYGCTATIQRGEDMVMNFIKRNTGAPTVLTYHVSCYIPWVTDMFNSKWSDWKNGDGNNPPPPRRGRPVKYKEATVEIKLNRLRALRTYHKKLGHTTKVERLDKKIGSLITPHDTESNIGSTF